MKNKFQIYRESKIANRISDMYSCLSDMKEYINEMCENRTDILFQSDLIEISQRYHRCMASFNSLATAIKTNELEKIEDILDMIERGV